MLEPETWIQLRLARRAGRGGVDRLGRRAADGEEEVAPATAVVGDHGDGRRAAGRLGEDGGVDAVALQPLAQVAAEGVVADRSRQPDAGAEAGGDRREDRRRPAAERALPGPRPRDLAVALRAPSSMSTSPTARIIGRPAVPG